MFLEPVDLPIVGKDIVIDEMYLAVDIIDHRIALLDLVLDQCQLREVCFFIFLDRCLRLLQFCDLLLNLPALAFEVFTTLRSSAGNKHKAQQVHENGSHGRVFIRMNVDLKSTGAQNNT